ncbi:hypothetical protein Tco_1541132 [Tanacetum coccineum]
MFLTRIYRHIMEAYHHLDNGIYDIVDRVMRPLALKQTRRPRSDRGKACHSVSSSSSHHQGTSSHQHDDDDDVETSRASTLSPTTYFNSLDPVNYQNYQMPSASERTDETLFERQTDLLNQIDLILSGGDGNDKGSAAANSVMHALVDADRADSSVLTAPASSA